MKHFKLTLATVVFSLCATLTQAQTDSNTLDDKNILKVNLLSLPFKNIHVQYERAFSNKMSFALGVRMMPKSGIPFKNTIISLAEDDDELVNQIDNFKTSNFAITPEIRFYMGKKALKGFYIAPFARYSKYTVSMPFEYTDDNNNTNTIDLSGDLTTFTGGIQFGSQFKLSKAVYLDWWILGPQYGTSNGNVDGKKALTQEEQDDIRESLEDMTADLPLIKATYQVDGNGVRGNIKGPWGGVRAGLALGIRF